MTEHTDLLFPGMGISYLKFPFKQKVKIKNKLLMGNSESLNFNLVSVSIALKTQDLR